MPILSRFRTIFLVLALGCALAALFPEVALLPIRPMVAKMRTPEMAVPLARGLCAAAAIVFAIVFAAWRRLGAPAQRVVTAITGLPLRTFWILVSAVAALPRLLIALGIDYEPRADAGEYHLAASALATGRGLAVDGEPIAYRAPGYPLLLSLTYRLFGPDVALAWVWGTLSCAVVIVAIYVIAARLHGAAVARLAALCAAGYPALALMTGQSLSDLPFVAGLMTLVAFVVLGTPYRVAGSMVIGVAVGLLTLTRGAAFGLFVVVPLIWHLRQPDPRKYAGSLLVVTLAFAACIAPWMLRNYSVFGIATLGPNIGTNAYVGNHRGAPGGAVPDHWPDAPAVASRNEAQKDRALMRAAIDFVVAHPGEAAAILPKKLMHLYLLETEVVTSLFQGEHPSPAWIRYALYAISQLAYVFFLLLFGARALELATPAHRPHGAQWTGWLLVGYFTLLCLVFHGQDRYRLPILPWILIEAAVLLARLWENGDRPHFPAMNSRALRRSPESR